MQTVTLDGDTGTQKSPRRGWVILGLALACWAGVAALVLLVLNVFGAVGASF